jgi:hypothetical protein
MTQEQIEAEICARMPLQEFLKIQERLAFLRNEEELKLKALAELQQVYLAATSDERREMVKQAVGQIREISKKTREEIRALNSAIFQKMPLDEAKQLYEKYLTASHNPK